MRRLDITAGARRDIDQILDESRGRHGLRTAARYRRLIAFALRELWREPAPPASKAADAGNLRLYALRFAARRLDERVRAPPHVVVYRFDAERVEIVRLLHEAMDLPRHLAALPTSEGLGLPRDD